MPFGPARVKSKRSMPEVGDIIFIREHNSRKNKYGNPWKQVIVDMIRDGDIYFVHGYP
jgi:hypothetical protein